MCSVRVCVPSEMKRVRLSTSNGFNYHNRITEINCGLATHVGCIAHSLIWRNEDAQGSTRARPHTHIRGRLHTRTRARLHARSKSVKPSLGGILLAGDYAKSITQNYP